jgi:hypothetical protein
MLNLSTMPSYMFARLIILLLIVVLCGILNFGCAKQKVHDGNIYQTKENSYDNDKSYPETEDWAY